MDRTAGSLRRPRHIVESFPQSPNLPSVTFPSTSKAGSAVGCIDRPAERRWIERHNRDDRRDTLRLDAARCKHTRANGRAVSIQFELPTGIEIDRSSEFGLCFRVVSFLRRRLPAGAPVHLPTTRRALAHLTFRIVPVRTARNPADIQSSTPSSDRTQCCPWLGPDRAPPGRCRCFSSPTSLTRFRQLQRKKTALRRDELGQLRPSCSSRYLSATNQANFVRRVKNGKPFVSG